MDIFIGWDSRYPEPALVLAASILEHTSIPVDIHYLHLENIKRKYGFDRPLDPEQMTEFTYTRFLVPFIQHYEGKALFLGNNTLALTDVAELDQLPMEDVAIRCVRRDHRTADALCNVMLFNCEKLQLWTKPVVEQQPWSYLHYFQDIPDELVGDIDPAWNQLDSYEPGKTKLINWTNGMVWDQPGWKELRAVGKLPEYPYRELWLEAFDRWAARATEAVTVRAAGHPQLWKPIH